MVTEWKHALNFWLFLVRFENSFGLFFTLLGSAQQWERARASERDSTSEMLSKIKSQALELILGLPIVTSVLVFKTADKMQNYTEYLDGVAEWVASQNQINSNTLDQFSMQLCCMLWKVFLFSLSRSRLNEIIAQILSINECRHLEFAWNDSHVFA